MKIKIKKTGPAHQRLGYIRVSSEGQNTDRQLEGIELDKVFTDKLSGKNAERPQLQAMMKHAREGDHIMVHSMDRLARNTKDLLTIVNDLTDNGITVEFIKEKLVFSGDDNPMAKLQLTMIGAFAEFERSIARERQREGIELAKKRGAFKGRKPVLTPERAKEFRERYINRDFKSLSALSREFGIAQSTAYNYIGK